MSQTGVIRHEEDSNLGDTSQSVGAHYVPHPHRRTGNVEETPRHRVGHLVGGTYTLPPPAAETIGERYLESVVLGRPLSSAVVSSHSDV